jgi:predicted metalloprotease with PDZ domain
MKGLHLNVQYTLSITQPTQHLLDVVIDVRDVQAPYLDFMLPTWTPGSYLIREYARHVQDVAAEAGDQPAPWQKSDKQTWRVQTNGADHVVLRYRVYGNELTVRTNHVDDTHAHVIPAATFMYVVGVTEQPLNVMVGAPEGWNIATSLNNAPNVPPFHPSTLPTFAADNYDHLVDSPFEIGVHRVLPFETDGKAHRIVVWGHGNEDDARLVADTQKIVQAARDFWGELPYEHYTFFLLLGGKSAGGGLEHRNSTSLLLPRFTFKPDRSYERFLTLTSHEFFHVWNVKRLRAQGLGPFDYTRETYTTLLWAMEGITEYYTDLLLVRAGLLPTKRYLERLADDIVTLQGMPGRQVQSLECASFDAWIKLYRPDENSSNTSVSYYLKGAVVAALLDLEIRRRTQAERSLDDVMRYLHQAYPLDGPGIADRYGYVEAIKDVTGQDLTDFFDRYIAGTNELPYDELLGAAGLALRWDWKDKTNGEPQPTLGVRLKQAGGQLLVASVVSDGPAYAAGLHADDEIVAIDGYRVADEASLRDRLHDHRAGDTVALTIFRREELRGVHVVLAPAPHDTLTLEQVADPTDEQRRVRASWLGQ